jgi:hypothetical protein
MDDRYTNLLRTPSWSDGTLASDRTEDNAHLAEMVRLGFSQADVTDERRRREGGHGRA